MNTEHRDSADDAEQAPTEEGHHAHEGRRGRRGRGRPGPGGAGPGGRGNGGGGPRSRGRGRRGPGFSGRDVEPPPASDAADWFAGRLPSEWFAGAPTISVDREEIVVRGELSPDTNGDDALSPAAAQGRISRWRQDTREDRVAIAAEAQARYGRTVSWGASLGAENMLFTHLAVPTMTRLRQPERQVLDTLVDAGVARSRSEAVAWAVTLVGQHSQEWLDELREAMSQVDKVREAGPQA
ncbi:MAG: hypothetical protein WBG76_02050 [Ornithinimicrobium sp.]